MKKLNIVLLSSVLLLAACGEENAEPAPVEQETTATTENVEEAESTEIEEETAEPDSEEATDEAVEQGDGLDYNDPAELIEGLAHPIKYYSAEDSTMVTEEGMTTVDFEGFNIDFTVFLVDFKPSEEYLYDYEEKETIRALLVTTIAENTNDFDVDYNGNITFTTDTKEQVSGDPGIMSSNTAVQTYYGQVEAEGYYIIPLEEDSSPTELTAIMEGPWKVENGAVNTEDGPMGGEKRISLVAEE